MFRDKGRVVSETSYRRSSEALHAEIGEDVVALHVRLGNCFGMEQVTADVWRLLEQEMSLTELCARLVELYEVDAETCRAEVGQLLGIMEKEGLLKQA